MRPAPKHIKENIEYRKFVLRKCDADKRARELYWVRASRDLTYFIDTFCYTYSPKDNPDHPDRPFILYPYQDKAMLTMANAIGKHPILIEKSRDLGATWMIVTLFLWRWLFFRGQSFLLGSRKQELVDKTGDTKTLFAKADYQLRLLPGWMVPNFDRTLLHLYNSNTNSTIDGESTNDDFARGDRRTAIMLDEFPAVDNGYQILKAVGDATMCPIFAGTSQGAAGAYYDVRMKMADSNPERIIRLHWSEHPEKRKGLYTTENGEEGGPLKIIDTDYQFPKNYNFIRDGLLRSVAYDEREKQAANPQEMAQEWRIDYLSSAYQWFEQKMLERLKKETVLRPFHTGEIIAKPDWRTPVWDECHGGGRVKLWFHPDEMDSKTPRVPESWKDVVCGVDVATGKGGEMSSQSAASFARRTTGEKIAEFTTNSLSPQDFCVYVLSLCRWFNNAYLVHEDNGPGGEFTRQLSDNSYRNVFKRNEDETGLNIKKTKKFGWWSNKQTKRVLLSDYARALRDGSYINRSAEAIAECAQFIMQPDGTIEHSRSRVTPDPNASGENHGDIVIADALAFRGMDDIAKPGLKETEKPPAGSYLERRKNWERRQTKTTRGWGRIAG